MSNQERVSKTPEEVRAIMDRRQLKAAARVEIDTLLGKWMQQDGLTLPETIEVLRESQDEQVDWLAAEFECHEAKAAQLAFRLKQASALIDNLTRALDQAKTYPSAF